MEFSGNYGVSRGERTAMRPLYWVLCLISLIPVAVVLPMAPTRAGIAIVTAWIALIWIAISYARGQFHSVVPVWLAVYPYCYYLFSFPRERSIFTIDRALVLLLMVEMVLIWRWPCTGPSRDMRVSAYLWGLYLLVCFLSLASHPATQVLPSYRLLVDGMLMPAMLGLYAWRYFPLLENLARLHVCTCLLGVGLFITGFFELTSGIDLFPWVGSEPMFTDTHVRRPDGPFEQQIVLSVVAILVFFFVVYLRRLMPVGVPTWRRWLHKAGATSAFAAALLPLNRSLVLVLLPVAVIDSFSKQRLVSRRKWAVFFSIVAIAAVTAKLSDPRLYDDRVARPDNFYQRLAQHRETLRVIREYPFFGVGFGLYHDIASKNPRYMATWNGIESMNFPHNVMMSVLSEEGLVGLLFYVSAQIFLIRAMWKVRKVFAPGWLAFLYCVIIYEAIGLDYATVYFSDINLLYLFVLCGIYQVQIRIAHQQTAALGSSANLELVEAG